MKHLEKSALVMAAYLLSAVSTLSGLALQAQAAISAATETVSENSNCGSDPEDKPPF
jgi:hypothetical protein